MSTHGSQAAVAVATPREPDDAGTDTPTAHELRAFVAVARHLHFGRAARELGLAQSSLSETLRRLERKLGLVLFERSSRRVLPTPAGADLLPLAVDVLTKLTAVRARATRADAPDARLLIGAQGAGLGPLHAPVLRELRSQCPELEVAMTEVDGTPEGSLRSGADAAVVYGPCSDPRLEYTLIGFEERGLVVGSEHWARAERRVSLEAILDEPFVSIGAPGTASAAFWSAEHERGCPPRIVTEAHSSIETFNAIALGGAVSTGCRSWVTMLAQFGLAFVPVDGLDPAAIQIAVRRGESRPAVHAFRETARRLAREVGLHVYPDDRLTAGVLAD